MDVLTDRSPDAIRQAWITLQERDPGIRTRNAAAELRVSEAELLATRCGDGVRRIDADIPRFLPRIESLGRVKALTRNDNFVHEKNGVYRNVYVNPHAAQVVDEDIDLRIFPAMWRSGFAVEDETRRGTQRSLQFFDSHGVAVHKIFLLGESDVRAYDSLVNDLLSEDQSRAHGVDAHPSSATPRPDEDVDVTALEAGWRAMQNTHDFFGLLRKHDVARTQAFHLVSDELARPATNSGLRTILERASADEIDIMVFVRSPGTYQIHHGPVRKVVDTPEWLNVLDPGFNLHVREGGIASTWVVRKPTENGWVTSVELFDRNDELDALIFGCHAEGKEENPKWRELAELLDVRR